MTVNTPPTGSVTLAGNAAQYEVLTAGNTLADADGIGPIAYQWQRAVGQGAWAAIPGATDPAYVLGQADVGATIRVLASYTDQLGTNEAVASAASPVVLNVNDPPVGDVQVTGQQALQGVPLTAAANLSDLDGMGTVTFRWQRSDNAGGWTTITGATTATYVPTQADVGFPLRAVAGYTDQQGTVESVASDPTGPIGNVEDAPTGGLFLSGAAVQGLRLSVASTVADADGMGPVTYRWQRLEGAAGWFDIAGPAEPASSRPRPRSGMRSVRCPATRTCSAPTRAS